jgi:hypothetical protein
MNARIPRQVVPCSLSKAKVSIAHMELQVLGLCVMNNWVLGPTKFSLCALRDGVSGDDSELPDFQRYWCLRSMRSRQAKAIFIECSDWTSVEMAANQVGGLLVHWHPSERAWSVITAESCSLIHWPERGAKRGTRR